MTQAQPKLPGGGKRGRASKDTVPLSVNSFTMILTTVPVIYWTVSSVEEPDSAAKLYLHVMN